MARPMRSPTPTGSRTPPFQVIVGVGEEGREQEKERGARLLGFVVISKKFLRSRKIMVMHSNERGEYDLRTL